MYSLNSVCMRGSLNRNVTLLYWNKPSPACMGVCGRREIGLLDEDADRVTLLSSEVASSCLEECKLVSAILMRRQAAAEMPH